MLQNDGCGATHKENGCVMVPKCNFSVFAGRCRGIYVTMWGNRAVLPAPSGFMFPLPPV
ncbi:MAG: hypothetical protein BWY09_01739 [Candidatus Hydrogenedentes bacterium ADurb.Bin179]|nr:MAG: hypothetical protein BWY09_01739 [Candidatus Hydrogenedentes bacterium ADurb.Bin179]